MKKKGKGTPLKKSPSDGTGGTGGAPPTRTAPSRPGTSPPSRPTGSAPPRPTTSAPTRTAPGRTAPGRPGGGGGGTPGGDEKKHMNLSRRLDHMDPYLVMEHQQLQMILKIYIMLVMLDPNQAHLFVLWHMMVFLMDYQMLNFQIYKPWVMH